jgi:predicted metal-dependent enzyme (double-stranded beta helix superfamily)
VAGLDRLRHFIADMTALVDGASDRGKSTLAEKGSRLLADLVKHDDWLPEFMAQCPPHGYAQNLLWCDPFERFSVVSFVWAPRARTPIHDHQVWGLVGMMRGSESSQRFERDATTGALNRGECAALAPGEVEVLLPARGDIHQVSNTLSDSGSLSIHVYGGNIGAVRRYTFDDSGKPELFVSGYSNKIMPNLWDRSEAVRQDARRSGTPRLHP